VACPTCTLCMLTDWFFPFVLHGGRCFCNAAGQAVDSSRPQHSARLERCAVQLQLAAEATSSSINNGLTARCTSVQPNGSATSCACVPARSTSILQRRVCRAATHHTTRCRRPSTSRSSPSPPTVVRCSWIACAKSVGGDGGGWGCWLEATLHTGMCDPMVCSKSVREGREARNACRIFRCDPIVTDLLLILLLFHASPVLFSISVSLSCHHPRTIAPIRSPVLQDLQDKFDRVAAVRCSVLNQNCCTRRMRSSRALLA
jgi:hypothetical protein